VPACSAARATLTTPFACTVDINLKRTFGGTPAFLLNFGDIHPQARWQDGDIDAERSDYHGKDTNGVISVVLPWSEVGAGIYLLRPPLWRTTRDISMSAAAAQVKQGPYFISVLNVRRRFFYLLEPCLTARYCRDAHLNSGRRWTGMGAS
jgi:hypothetical protein